MKKGRYPRPDRAECTAPSYTAQRPCVDCCELNISGGTAVPGQAPAGMWGGGLKAVKEALPVVWKGRG